MKKMQCMFLLIFILFCGCIGCMIGNERNSGSVSTTTNITMTNMPEISVSPKLIVASTPTPAWEPTVTSTPTLALSPILESEATSVPTPTPARLVTSEPIMTPEPTATSAPAPALPDFSQSEKIPVISVVTEHEQPVLSKEEYVKCRVSVCNTEEYGLLERPAGIRVRGNSSAYGGNKEDLLTKEVPYRIKFEEKTNLLGLNDEAECKSWVVLRADEGLVRDEIAFRLGRVLLGESNYCSDSQLVHLYVNGEFKGVFLLCEQSQVNKHRVDVYEPKKEEIQTDIGYFLEIDNYANESEHPCFYMDYEKAQITDIEGVTNTFSYAYYSIKSDIRSEEQKEFISSYTRNLFKLVYEACINQNYLTFDEECNLVKAEYDNAKDTVDAVLNLDSVVGSYILEELMHDKDCGEGSFFMCIDFSEGSKYPKFTFTCPWDYNWTCQGNAQGQYYAAAFNAPDFAEKYGERSNPWFILLMTQDWFVELVKERWTEIRLEGTLEDCFQEEKDYMEEYKSDLNRKKNIATDTGYAVLGWLERRMEWLDEEWLLQ